MQLPEQVAIRAEEDPDRPAIVEVYRERSDLSALLFLSARPLVGYVLPEGSVLTGDREKVIEVLLKALAEFGFRLR